MDAEDHGGGGGAHRGRVARHKASREASSGTMTLLCLGPSGAGEHIAVQEQSKAVGRARGSAPLSPLLRCASAPFFSSHTRATAGRDGVVRPYPAERATQIAESEDKVPTVREELRSPASIARIRRLQRARARWQRRRRADNAHRGVLRAVRENLSRSEEGETS